MEVGHEDAVEKWRARSEEVASLRKVYPLEFHRKFLAHGVRSDGRFLDSPRPVQSRRGIIGSAYGSAICRKGNTVAVSGVSAELAACPLSVQDRRRQIVCNVEMSFSENRDGKPSEQAQALGSWLSRTISDGNIVDTSCLLVSPPHLQWYLIVDVYIISLDGSVYDAALCAAMEALCDTRIPELLPRPGGFEQWRLVGVARDSAKPARALLLKDRLRCSTFAVVEGVSSRYLITDPSSEEELIAASTIVVVLDAHGNLCSLQHFGGCLVSDELIDTCVANAERPVSE